MRFKYILSLLFLLPLAAIAQNGETVIGERTFYFNDTIRNRKLVTEIWYPTNDDRKPSPKEDYPFLTEPTVRNGVYPVSKHPLILLSHGTGGGRMTLEWMADLLVKQGFIVAAVDHWGNTYDHKIAIEFLTPWQRPQDISFVLTQILKDKSLDQIIDKQRIGAAGFSIGGYTVLALAGARLDLNALTAFTKTTEGIKETAIPEFPGLLKTLDEAAVRESFINSPVLKDGRIKAFFAICPAIGQGFIHENQFESVKDPVYLVGAQSDSIAPVKTNVKHYHQLLSKSTLYLVPGKAGHYLFLNEANTEVKKSGIAMFNDNPSVNRHAVHELVGGMAVEFFKRNLT
ncbi:prolyl oligopeptidase family serine peptidase [Pedobacter sp. L105]|uniref:alpha/beta hydrolase family protein n=1 Tax=Pedobacter sp. L105 TaxID=1641871 RepID=UPI00131AE01C|nr:dienelactone hydrolase [Pedobacter sp. L105]